MSKRTLFAVGLLASAALFANSAAAQMNVGPMPTAEQRANAGKYDPPKLTDLAAKLASQPDMTGLWQALQPPTAGVGPTFDPENTYYPAQPPPGEARFGPMPGTYLKSVPYKPEYKKQYEQFIKEAMEGKSRDTFAACVPYGVPRMIGDSPVAFDIIQAPDVMFWYNDYGRSERRIFLDGRRHPGANEATATGGAGASYSGHSTGHWEGNTLVVDTVDMLAGNYDETAAPYSDKLHMVERMRLIDKDLLEIEMTFTDPVMLEKPWVVTRFFRRSAGFRGPAPAAAAGASPAVPRAYINLNDRPCIPNVGMDENGYQVLLLPQEVEAGASAVIIKKDR